jgi:hypothetical protein
MFVLLNHDAKKYGGLPRRILNLYPAMPQPEL